MRKSLDIAATALTALLLLGFAALALRGLIDPQSASARFGSAVSDPAGTLFYRVYLSRNLVIVVAGAILLVSRRRPAHRAGRCRESPAGGREGRRRPAFSLWNQ